MGENNEKKYIKISVLVTFVSMVIINALANIIPINGLNTGQVSDSYPNLFAPAGYTFSIWGLIYLLLGMYTLYQLGLFRKKGLRGRDRLINRVGVYFSISSISNIFWILSWHYNFIGMSVVLMGIILLMLILINKNIKQINLTAKEKLFVQLPFSVYFGWITVATIANITTWLVSINWHGLGLSETIWTVIVLLIGALIGSVTLLKNKDIPYGLVIIWAYAGIFVKHISDTGFQGKYLSVIITVIISIVIIVGSIVKSMTLSRRKLKY